MLMKGEWVGLRKSRLNKLYTKLYYVLIEYWKDLKSNVKLGKIGFHLLIVKSKHLNVRRKIE